MHLEHKKKKKMNSHNSAVKNPIKKWAKDLNRHFTKDSVYNYAHTCAYTHTHTHTHTHMYTCKNISI